MNIRPIRNEEDHRAALRELAACFEREPEPGSEAGDRFEILLNRRNFLNPKVHKGV